MELDDDDEPQADPGELVRLAPADAPPPAPRLVVDDVLDMHRFLEAFEGGTVELLARLGGRGPE
ncbi:MAG: hypothetical protein R3C32_04720 [Chloroflexota bacterium]